MMYAMRKAGVLSIPFVVVLLAFAVIADAQQAAKVFKIGWLSPSSAASSTTRFRRSFVNLAMLKARTSLSSLDTRVISSTGFLPWLISSSECHGVVTQWVCHKHKAMRIIFWWPKVSQPWWVDYRR